MATYPDTNLAEGAVDALYGGEASRKFGGKAWDWVARAIREIQTQIVAHVWSSYRMQKVLAGDAWVTGDLLVYDTSGAGSTFTVVKVGDVTYDQIYTPRYGVAYEAASVGEKAWVILDGAGIPPAVHGLGEGTADTVCFNVTTSRLERTAGRAGQKDCGVINTKGYVFLWARHGSND